MEHYTFDDALTGSSVTCGFPQLDAVVTRDVAKSDRCTSLFFPGCSFLNYGLPLVQAVYQTLIDEGLVDGISLLCCGKILSYEPEGDNVRASFEVQLRDRLAKVGVKRIVAACPNCVVALRAALSGDERTASIEVTALPVELAQRGYRIEMADAVSMVKDVAGCEAADVRMSVHDPCPDRDTGEFADGLRALMPADLMVEGPHVRKRSYCCGSLLRACGKPFVADAMAQRHGEEARSLEAVALVTACMSCAFQLSVAQSTVPVFHYLELLYHWRIAWEDAYAYLKLRFLFDEALGAVEASGSSRTFASLEAPINEEPHV
ncbi:MAG: heterodisulfide reductase-related iron-sulfur binding cluster [Gordonibacter sp.]|nr:heterodisulfide reductase-related iron-sulfur binding cluster [Gordonibacter sp.]